MGRACLACCLAGMKQLSLTPGSAPGWHFSSPSYLLPHTQVASWCMTLTPLGAFLQLRLWNDRGRHGVWLYKWELKITEPVMAWSECPGGKCRHVIQFNLEKLGCSRPLSFISFPSPYWAHSVCFLVSPPCEQASSLFLAAGLTLHSSLELFSL